MDAGAPGSRHALAGQHTLAQAGPDLPRWSGRPAGAKRLDALLTQLAENPAGYGGGFPLATDVPLTTPEPDVVFEGQTFLFAGEMAYGPLHACEREVTELGGTCEPSVNRRTDYVVIGSIGASDWCQSSFGEVLDEVVQYRARGVPISVLSEEHWTASLP